MLSASAQRVRGSFQVNRVPQCDGSGDQQVPLAQYCQEIAKNSRLRAAVRPRSWMSKPDTPAASAAVPRVSRKSRTGTPSDRVKAASRADRCAHRNLATVFVLGCAGFKADDSRIDIYVFDLELDKLADAPTVCPAHFDESSEPGVWARPDQLLVLRVLQEAFAHVVFIGLGELLESENFGRSRAHANAEHALQRRHLATDVGILSLLTQAMVYVLRYEIASNLGNRTRRKEPEHRAAVFDGDRLPSEPEKSNRQTCAHGGGDEQKR